MDTSEDAPQVVGSAEKKNFKLEIIRQVKVSQSQNGLRHGDYQRYRQYCTRRLRRVRKSLAFTNAPAKKDSFELKLVQPSLVTDERYLTIPLLNAERAWSYAMQLKNDMTQETQRKRFHLLKRLQRAAKWSAALEKLAAECTDTQTQLESEAYASWMHGNLDLERDNHKEAAAKFAHAKVVYEQLGQIGGMSLKDLCQEKIAALEPSLRYCNYILERKGGSTEEIKKLQASSEMNDLLRSKLEHVVEEKRVELAQALDHVEWQGKSIPLKNEKIQLGLVTATDLEAEWDSKSEETSDSLDGILGAYEEALGAIRSDIREAEKTKTKGTTGLLGVSEDAIAHLKALKDYVLFRKLKITKARNERMAFDLSERLTAQQEGAVDSTTKRVKPDDLVHLYEKIVDNVTEMGELDEQRSQISEQQLKAQKLTAKAFRCFYLAESYYRFQKYSEAHCLFRHTADRAEDALRLNEEASKERLQALTSTAKARMCHVQATSHLEQERTMEKLGETSLENKSKSKKEATLFERLDHYYAATRLVSFPPDAEATPCKPVLFDLAFNDIQFNDVSSRFAKSQGQSGGGGWFGGLFGS